MVHLSKVLQFGIHWPYTFRQVSLYWELLVTIGDYWWLLVTISKHLELYCAITAHIHTPQAHLRYFGSQYQAISVSSMEYNYNGFYRQWEQYPFRCSWCQIFGLCAVDPSWGSYRQREQYPFWDCSTRQWRSIACRAITQGWWAATPLGIAQMTAINLTTCHNIHNFFI